MKVKKDYGNVVPSKIYPGLSGGYPGYILRICLIIFFPKIYPGYPG